MSSIAPPQREIAVVSSSEAVSAALMTAVNTLLATMTPLEYTAREIRDELAADPPDIIIRHYASGTDVDFIRLEHDEWRRSFLWEGTFIAVVDEATARELTGTRFISILPFPFRLPVLLDALQKARMVSIETYLTWKRGLAENREAASIGTDVLSLIDNGNAAAALERLATIKVKDLPIGSHTVRRAGLKLIERKSKIDPNDAAAVAAFRKEIEDWLIAADLRPR